MDASKRLVNLFLAASTLMAWVLFTKIYATVFTTFGVRDAHLLGRQFTTSTLIAAATAVVLLFWILRHPRHRPWLQEAGDELVKVTWPTWEETRNQTKVTVVVTLVIAVILWLFDQVFGNLTGWILGA
jgi:preprotein translocase subunit SecE